MTMRSIGTAGLVLALGCATSSGALMRGVGGALMGGVYWDGWSGIYFEWEDTLYWAPEGDGPTVDLVFTVDGILGDEPMGFTNEVRAVNGAHFVGTGGVVTPLHYGDVVGASSQFAHWSSHTYSQLGPSTTVGSLDWTQPGGAALGFSFRRADGVHYGYLRLVMSPRFDLYMIRTTLTDVVYESRPDTPVVIRIPEPGLLLPGLACLWLTQSRRRRIA